jgi:golgi to ER traffic protein 4
LLNFLSLLLIAVQRSSADLFRDLTRHYTPHIKEVGIWDETLATIGEMYFNIKIPRQGNPLLDMMGNMFFGGGQGQGGGTPRLGPSRGSTKKVEAAPSSAELD